MTSYGSPSYYAQVLFGTYLGTEVVESNLTGGGPRLFYSVTNDAAKGVLYLKLVNASSTIQPMDIKLQGATKVSPTAKVVSLSARTTDETNSITDPKRIVPVASSISGVGASFHHTVPAYSIEVLQISTK